MTLTKQHFMEPCIRLQNLQWPNRDMRSSISCCQTRQAACPTVPSCRKTLRYTGVVHELAMPVRSSRLHPGTKQHRHAMCHEQSQEWARTQKSFTLDTPIFALCTLFDCIIQKHPSPQLESLRAVIWNVFKCSQQKVLNQCAGRKFKALCIELYGVLVCIQVTDCLWDREQLSAVSSCQFS